jgi:hypothetical protein
MHTKIPIFTDKAEELGTDTSIGYKNKYMVWNLSEYLIIFY